MKNILSFKIFLLLAFLLFSACGGSSSHVAPQIPEGDVPLMTLKQSSLTSITDHLTGTLTIYSSPDNAKISSQKINLSSNSNGETVVSTKPVELERSTPYRFVLIFYWDKVAIAYVDTTQATENDDSTTITYSEGMIVTTASTSSTADSLISADISAGFLPDLDEDDDGYSNLIELRCKTIPTDASDYPRGPKISNFKAQQQSDGLTLKITADIFDGLGVKSANLSFTNATHLTELLTESLDGKDGDVTRHYTGTVTPQNAGVTSLDLFLHTLDDEDLYKDASLNDVDITALVNTDEDHNVGPAIHFSTLSAGEVVSGTHPLSFQVIDKDGVQSFELVSPKMNASANFVSGSIIITKDTFYGVWDTSILKDGAFTVTVKAIDGKGASSFQDLPVTISKGSKEILPTVSLDIYPYETTDIPENLIKYLGGETVDGTVNIRARASHPNGMDVLGLTSGDLANGAMLNTNADPTTATTYGNVIDTTKLTDGKVTLLFEASSITGEFAIRDFTFRVQNYPTIESFTVNNSSTATLTNTTGKSVTFDWSGTKADQYKISRDGIDILTGTTDSSATTDITASGKYTLTLTNNTNLNGSFNKSASVTITVDDDADGVKNEEDAFSNDPTETIDADGDGVGANADCDDHDPNRSPAKTEICDPDNIDEDCDGFADDNDPKHNAIGKIAYYVDSDGDGYGSTTSANFCHLPLSGYSSNSNDCNDTNAAVHPTANELCSTDSDDDCNGVINESTAIDAKTWYIDQDNDGDGYVGTSIKACAKPTGYSISSTDCDDNDPSVSEQTIYYQDLDGDGYGSTSAKFCHLPSGYVTNAQDCDDDNAVVNPSITEKIFDGLDNDCDDTTDFFSLKWSYAKFIGEATGDKAGYSVVSAGDVNGDGFDDILIGAYNNDSAGTNAGIVYLIYGSANLTTDYANKIVQNTLHDINFSDADAKFIGEVSGDNAGYSVAGAGDVNGDGFDDILIGAPYNDVGGTLSNAGATYLIYGGSTNETVGRSDGGLILKGTRNLSLVGATNGIKGAKFTGEVKNSNTGYSVASGGDIDGNGYNDILMGAPYLQVEGPTTGGMYIIYGSPTKYTGSPSLSGKPKFYGYRDGDAAGYAVSTAGDVNKDGFDDILVGAPCPDFSVHMCTSKNGIVYVIYGSQTQYAGSQSLVNQLHFTGQSTDGRAGSAVANAGDVNKDGFDDILIGSFKSGSAYISNAGYIYLIYGTNTLTSASLQTVGATNGLAGAQFIGEANSDGAGISVSGVGDVDYDGYDDFIIGAYQYDPSQIANAGGTYLIKGSSTPPTGRDISLSSADARFTGEVAGDTAGYSVSGAGDFNGDSYDDLLIGAPGVNSSTGAAYLILSHYGK